MLLQDVLVGNLLIENDSTTELKHLHHFALAFVDRLILADLVHGPVLLCLVSLRVGVRNVEVVCEHRLATHGLRY